MSKWVQHRSGDGEKWEVITIMNGNDYWVVHNQGRNTELKLPLSEYIECSPPEAWVDVTDYAAIFIDDCNHIRFDCDGGDPMLCPQRYRLRKVPVSFIGPERQHGCERGEAFIVEKRLS